MHSIKFLFSIIFLLATWIAKSEEVEVIEVTYKGTLVRDLEVNWAYDPNNKGIRKVSEDLVECFSSPYFSAIAKQQLKHRKLRVTDRFALLARASKDEDIFEFSIRCYATEAKEHDVTVALQRTLEFFDQHIRLNYSFKINQDINDITEKILELEKRIEDSPPEEGAKINEQYYSVISDLAFLDFSSDQDSRIFAWKDRATTRYIKATKKK